MLGYPVHCLSVTSRAMPCRVAVDTIDTADPRPGRATWSLGPLFRT